MQTLLFANIKDNPDMPRADVREDFQTLKRSIRRLGIMGNCEIGEAEDHEDLARVFRTPFWYKLLQNNPNPQTVRTRWWKPLESKPFFVHKGVKGITPTNYIGYSLLRHRGLRRDLAVLTCHPVNGAFKPDKFPATIDIRRNLWFNWLDDLKDTVRTFHNDGISTIVMGDFNRNIHDVKFHPKQHLIAGAGIDGIFWVRGDDSKSIGITVESSGFVSTKNLNTDHLAPWVKVTFKR